MLFPTLFTTLLVASTTVSALASPAAAANNGDYKQVGRRLSRKHSINLNLNRRHWHHHHHHGHNSSSSSAPQPTPDVSTASDNNSTTTDNNGNTNSTNTNTGDDGDDSGDCSDEPAVVTVYTTVYSTAGTGSGSGSGGDGGDNGGATPTTTAATPTGSTGTSGGSGGTNGPAASGAVIQATGGQCGDPNAVPTPAPTSGPNGDENWLNCGVDGAGWVPPPITLENLIYQDLATVLNQNGNPFEACAPYLSFFQEQAQNTGIPEIFLASISLQESGCNPDATGGAGEIGMMQITSEKCPTDGTSCYDPEANIRIGAEYFQTVLNDQCNGNLACTMGSYNGWYPGLTVAEANNYSTCAQHNNLDYLQELFNGWLQGVDPGSIGMGIYHNTC